MVTRVSQHPYLYVDVQRPFSDDYSVQRTNDDATQCKFAAVQLGYWKDEFLPRFAYSGAPESRRDPEISIGYWARVSAVNHLVERFIDKTQGQCVLVYMSVDQSAQLLKHLSDTFDTAVFLNYEQVRIKDTFGSVMEKNLEQRGIQLPGLPACNDIDTQRERFLSNGWKNVVVIDMNAVYKKLLPQNEVSRIEKIEHLDEMELLRQLLDHYCIGYAVNDKSEKFTSRLVFPEL
ncbi:leucine carboxyl methyltransferase [Ostertagia ostertagi]